MSPIPPFVLIVEDSTDIALLIQAVLNNMGVESHHASDGMKALDFLAIRMPDLMLLDIGMPMMSGWEVLDQVKTRWPESTFPVIVLTAFEDPANKLIGKFQNRVFRYLTKPFSPSILMETVRAALERG
jgi:DNA-binding response OmpR family regulator